MNPKLAIALIAFTLPLAGCGNKGPLVLAQPPQPAQVQETAPGQVPVEIAPDPDLTGLGPTPSPDDPAVDDKTPPDDDAGG